MSRNYLGLENRVHEIEEHYLAYLYPDYFGEEYTDPTIKEKCEADKMMSCLAMALEYVFDSKEKVEECVSYAINRLGYIKELVKTDITAAYEGDPAATSLDEIILAYPAFKAISIFRFAHELYLKKVPIVPRMMTEFMHKLTGIDIHPGATVGKYFFIDHGTGVVIGETTTIGERVKIYQNVTLGAKSFDVGEDGKLVKGIKRHPNIGNNVVIYAGATILGGNTNIGDNAVIGGGTWVTCSVPAGATVTIKKFDTKNPCQHK